MKNIPRLLSILGIDAKNRGDEWIAKCPVHTDTDPSWSINENGNWYCFGCSSGGGLGLLIERIFNLSWQEAHKWLLENQILDESPGPLGNIQIEIPKVGAPPNFICPSEWLPREDGFGLRMWPTPVRKYIEGRGITETQVERWQLKYSVYGRLSGRVSLPHVNANGRICSYSARTFIGADPRYLTPDPKEHPNSAVMFGMNHWAGDECVVVTEGSIDALACERAGATNIAAFGGSPFSSYDTTRNKPPVSPLSVLAAINNLSKFKKILIATDPDKAGNKVYEALRPLSRWSVLSRVEIPDSMDCAKLDNSILRELLISAGM